MRRTWCVPVILLLGLGILPAKLSAQQPGGSTSGDRGAPVSRLGRNFPNPMNPTTTLEFEILDRDVGSNGEARVSLRIYNVLQQLVAIPKAKGGPNPDQPVENLMYPAGTYQAWWDGKDKTGNQVASGLYYIQLLVNGRSALIWKTLVAK